MTYDCLTYIHQNYTHFDEHGTAQHFDIVPFSTHRQTYRQMDTLQCPRILISPHGDYPILFKMRVMRHISLHIVTSAPPAPPDRGCNFYLIKYCIQDTTFAFVRHTLSCLNHHSHLMPANNWVLAGKYQQRLKVLNEYSAPTNSAICSLKFKLIRPFFCTALYFITSSVTPLQKMVSTYG